MLKRLSIKLKMELLKMIKIRKINDDNDDANNDDKNVDITQHNKFEK